MSLSTKGNRGDFAWQRPLQFDARTASVMVFSHSYTFLEAHHNSETITFVRLVPKLSIAQHSIDIGSR
jgi:hypothetical protein